jgi:epoxyqueuosine reductase
VTSLAARALAHAVKERAHDLGFDRVAIGPATAPEHGPAFERWLAAGYAGTMGYLARTREDRLDPQRLLPGARSVVAVALVYNAGSSPEGGVAATAPGVAATVSGAGESDRPDGAGRPARVARYARGRDYHDFMRPRVRRLADFIEASAGGRSRAAVDTSAVLERDLAAQAGLGWIGKNTNLLSPALGSWFFIGIVLTTARLEPDEAEPDHCGTCRACLDACPTRAFVAPWVLDARRCIAYLTIEHRGAVPDDLREGIGDWLFGCDVCQEVCPWNRRAPATRAAELLGPPPAAEPVDLLGLDAAAFRARVRGTALRRARREGLRRNAALVLGNRRDAGAAAALTAALDDPDPVVQDAARWALARIPERGDHHP